MAFFDVWRAENRRRDTGESQKESSVENDRKSTCRLDRTGDRSFGENRGGWTLSAARHKRGSARRPWASRPRRRQPVGRQEAADRRPAASCSPGHGRERSGRGRFADLPGRGPRACSTTPSTWATRRRRPAATWNGNATRRRSAAKPSQMFSPLGLNKNKKAPTTDPFAGRAPIAPPARRQRAASHAAAEGRRRQPDPLAVGAGDPSPMQPPPDPAYR